MGLTTLKMPQLGESVTEGTVERWLKAEGDTVRRDEPIVEVVTDKVNAEIPSPFEGRLVRIQVREGQTVAIGAALAELEVEGAATTPTESTRPGGVIPAESPPAPNQVRRAPAMTQGLKVSPAVRRLAERNGIEISNIIGTGAGGRSSAPPGQRMPPVVPTPLAPPGRARGRSSFASLLCAARSPSTWSAA